MAKIFEPKHGFELHGYKHNYIFFLVRHLELIDFHVSFNSECYLWKQINNETACHNQNNHDVI